MRTSPFSGGSPLPNVLVTTNTSVSCSRSTTSYSSIDVTCRCGKKTGSWRGDLSLHSHGEVFWSLLSPRNTLHTPQMTWACKLRLNTQPLAGGGCDDHSVLASNEMIICCRRTTSIHDSHLSIVVFVCHGTHLKFHAHTDTHTQPKAWKGNRLEPHNKENLPRAFISALRSIYRHPLSVTHTITHLHVRMSSCMIDHSGKTGKETKIWPGGKAHSGWLRAACLAFFTPSLSLFSWTHLHSQRCLGILSLTTALFNASVVKSCLWPVALYCMREEEDVTKDTHFLLVPSSPVLSWHLLGFVSQRVRDREEGGV